MNDDVISTALALAEIESEFWDDAKQPEESWAEWEARNRKKSGPGFISRMHKAVIAYRTAKAKECREYIDYSSGTPRETEYRH